MRPAAWLLCAAGCYAGEDWRQYYEVDPTDFGGTTEQVRQRVWPALAALRSGGVLAHSAPSEAGCGMQLADRSAI